MTKKWLNVGLAVSMLASVALVGCGGEEKPTDNASGEKPAEEQVLNLGLGDEIPTMDISKATDNIAFTMFAQTNEGLVRLDESGKPQPGVAKEWKVSDDGLTYTFTLRDDAKWSDGSAVTAQDFEYSWKRALNPDTGAQYGFMVAWVKGGAAYSGGKGSVDEVAVKAKDDKTLEVVLEAPVPFFVEQMAFPTFYPQKQAFVEQHGDKYGTDADKQLYNGPFKMTAWVHEQSATIEKNEHYWDNKNVKLEKVNFTVVKDSTALENLYLAGQVDRMGLVRDQVDRYKDSEEFGTMGQLTAGYFTFNTTKGALGNAKVRKALTYGLDAEAFADVIYHNGTVGAQGFVPAGTSNGQGGDFRKDNGDLINRAENLPKAKALLAEGLKEAGVTELKFKLLVDDGDIGKKMAEFVQEQWRTNLGLAIEVENVPFKLRLKRSHEGDFDVVMAAWGADYNDPMTFLDMWITGSDFNDAQWNNDKYNDLIKQAKAEVDAKKRMQLLYEAEKLLMEEMPIGPYVHRGSSFIMKKYVKGWVASTFGPAYDLKTTYIEGKE
jgi:oligopeptide transport system substrate-binding protein